MFDYNYQLNAVLQNQQLMNAHFNNLQNQFTPGYKAETVQFTDIMGQTMGANAAKQSCGGIIFTQGQIARTGKAVDCRLTPIPAIIFVPCPVVDASAICFTGP